MKEESKKKIDLIIKIVLIIIIILLLVTNCSLLKKNKEYQNKLDEDRYPYPFNQYVRQYTAHVENGDIIFTLSGSIKLETDGWIGICPNGNYVYEDDADNAGLTYDFFEERDSESDPYVFKVAYEGLEDGSYTMVLCDTDNSGYVMASWPLTIKDGKPAVDLSHFSLNPEPAGMPPKQSPAETVDPDGEDIDDDYDEGPAMTDFDEEPDDGADDA